VADQQQLLAINGEAGKNNLAVYNLSKESKRLV